MNNKISNIESNHSSIIIVHIITNNNLRSWEHFKLLFLPTFNQITNTLIWNNCIYQNESLFLITSTQVITHYFIY